jgi:hypothetical protein
MKQHKTLNGILPAMAAGVSDRLWPMEDNRRSYRQSRSASAQREARGALNAPYSNGVNIRARYDKRGVLGPHQPLPLIRIEGIPEALRPFFAARLP